MSRQTNTVSIYSLSDPRTQRIRYIGKTNNPSRRFANHICPSEIRQSHCINWVRSLQKIGLEPVMEILDKVPKSEWVFWEKEYIRLFRATCPGLTNLTDGGEGCEGYIASPESRRKISVALSGRKFSEEHRKNISIARTGSRASPETRKKYSDCRLGEKNHIFGRTGNRAPMFGKKLSLEARAKISENNRLRGVSETTLAKMRVSQTRRWEKYHAAQITS